MRSALLLVLLLATAGCLGGTDPTPSQTPTSAPTTAPAQSCDAGAPAPDAAWKAESPRVRLATSKGDIVLQLDAERAPLTASNFLGLVRNGTYDGKTFYRIAKDFVIQGGLRDGADGIPEIKDEFNPSLRHSAAGVVSMATAGPDTGGSEFFITLRATAGLDDRHAVFGKVAEGMDVVNAIAALPISSSSGDGPPTETVTITKAEEINATPFEARHAVGVHPVVKEKKGEPGRGVTFSVILANNGTVRDAVSLKATPPAGWTCAVSAAPTVPAGTARVVFLTLTPPSGASGVVEVPLAARSAWNGTPEATSTVKVNVGALGAQVKQGDKVTANYVGILPDGRLFDTSVGSIANDPAQPKFATQGGFTNRGNYAPFPFTVGSGVIAGFTNLAKTAKVGETVTSHIPAKDAYATGDMYSRPLTGRDLIFELEIVKVG